MEQKLTVLFAIVAIILIASVLLQSGKARGASQALSGGIDLFADRKERGSEIFITRFTYVLATLFCGIAFILSVVI